MKKKQKHKAYCWQSGEIEIGPREKIGTITLAASSKENLEYALAATARLAYDNKTWLVPRLREENNSVRKVVIAQEYSKILNERIKELMEGKK